MSNDQKIELYDEEILRVKNGELVCRKHPTYQGIFQPRIDCPGCWEVYLMRSRGKKQGAVHG